MPSLVKFNDLLAFRMYLTPTINVLITQKYKNLKTKFYEILWKFRTNITILKRLSSK